jgi:Zn-dependent protease
MDIHGIVILVGVVLIHELGHLAAMWAFGYKDLAVFFIPFFGAVATGRSAGGKAWQRGVVILAGPMPGILLGWVVIMLAPQAMVSYPYLAVTASMLLLVNGFNLLPLMPLDGGRLLNIVLFSRHPRLETWFTSCAGIALMFVALSLQMWLLAAVGLMTVVVAFAQRRLIRAAHQARAAFAGAPAEAELLTEEQRHLLFEGATRTVAAMEADMQGGGFEWTPQRRATVLASYMQVILDRATIVPASVLASAVLVLAYLASCALLWPVLRML